MNATNWEKELKPTTKEEIRRKHEIRIQLQQDEKIIKLLEEAIKLIKEKYNDVK